MKRFIKTALTAVLAVAAVACTRDLEPLKENINGTIDLSFTGVINGYTPQEETKAEAQTVVRIMWNGDETVYVFDGTECLGSLTASIEGKDSTYAKLSGTIEPTQATTLTFVYSPQFDAEPPVSDGKISLDLSTQDDEEVPFLIYATLPKAQAPATFSNDVVQFNLATSVFKCNCTGLSVDGEISQAAIKGVNTKCELTLSDSGVPEVSGSTPGTITRTAGFTQADQRAIFSVALPKTAASETGRTIKVTKGGRQFTASYPEQEFDVSKSFNSVFALAAVPYCPNPFTITSSGSTTVAIVKDCEPYDISLEYRKGSGEWYAYTVNNEIELTKGEFVQFRAGEGGNEKFSDDEDFYYISVEGDETVSASGNIMSLLDSSLEKTSLEAYIFNNLFCYCANLTDASNLVLPATELAEYCYANMFEGCECLTAAPELPATTLAEACYYYMFSGCAGLTAAPELPATELAEYCYANMFEGCEYLTAAPELPATTLADYCYIGMFCGCTEVAEAPELPATTLAEHCYETMFCACTSLTEAPVLPATTLAESCYDGMFSGCEGLTAAPALPATTLASCCYKSMFSYCTDLAAAPALSATTLANECYEGMFEGCEGLTAAPALPATTLADNCYYYMFSECTSLTEAPELPATTLANECYGDMFNGCTSLTVAPDLPAINLAILCYNSMFKGCSNLHEVKALFTTTPGNDYTSEWLEGVASSGTFVKNFYADWDVRGSDGIPKDWTVETYSPTQD